METLNTDPESSADNTLKVVDERINSGEVNTEYVIRISDRIELY
ncbi:MAG: hypothetical protein ACLPN1_18480 [Dissulfurispiraceae bacterium]|jgi:hypothetical protein